MKIWKNTLNFSRLFISHRKSDIKQLNTLLAPNPPFFQKRTIFKDLFQSFKKYRDERAKADMKEQDINEALHVLPSIIKEEPTLDAKLERLQEAISSWPRDSLTQRVALEIKWSILVSVYRSNVNDIQLAQKKFEEAQKVMQECYNIRYA